MLYAVLCALCVRAYSLHTCSIHHFQTNATFLTHHCVCIASFLDVVVFLLMVNSLHRKHTCNHPICYGIAKSHNKSHSAFTISSRQTHTHAHTKKNDKCLLWFLTSVHSHTNHMKTVFSIMRKSSCARNIRQLISMIPKKNVRILHAFASYTTNMMIGHCCPYHIRSFKRTMPNKVPNGPLYQWPENEHIHFAIRICTKNT